MRIFIEKFFFHFLNMFSIIKICVKLKPNVIYKGIRLLTSNQHITSIFKHDNIS
jgi:hypothetical protein